MSYKNWSAMDMALILELALQKEGDVQSNVRCALTNLSSKDKIWKRGDESLGEYCAMLLQMPDPAKSVRDVVNNFYSFLKQDDVFKAAPDPMVEEAVEVYHDLVIKDMHARLTAA